MGIHARWLRIQFVLVALFIWMQSGCAMLPEEVWRAPTDRTNMSQAIAAIVSIGTPRDVAIQKLQAAGIEGYFPRMAAMSSDGVGIPVPPQQQVVDCWYICHKWNRPNGEYWLIDANLEFNLAGKLSHIACEGFGRRGRQPGRAMLTRWRRGPDGELAMAGDGTDHDVPRLLHETSGASANQSTPELDAAHCDRNFQFARCHAADVALTTTACSFSTVRLSPKRERGTHPNGSPG